ncbi:MAG: hypothetical protein OEV30_06025 [Ignavibacteria bacterium]|nr:hypothetical protein [Ignavibacteria bacterium]
MTVSTTYLIRVLHGVEEKLEGEGHRREATLVSQLTSKFSASLDIQKDLDELLSVDGMEQLALALMWVRSRDRHGLNGLHQEVIDYDVNTLMQALIEQWADDGEDTPEPVPPASFREVLPEFSLVIAELARRAVVSGSFRGIPEEYLWKLKAGVDTLRLSAVREAEVDVIRFCDALDLFLGYVLKHRLLTDLRVIGVIQSANLTLQTVIGGRIPEDRGSLDQTIELLMRPSLFFEQKPE